MSEDSFEIIFDATLKMQADKSYNEAIDEAVKVVGVISCDGSQECNSFRNMVIFELLKLKIK